MAHDELRDSTWEEDSVMLHHDDVSDFNQDNILPLEADKLAKVREWLQPTVSEGEGSEFTKHSTAHLPGTGKWLLQSPAYQEWHEGKDRGLLWIRGIPGSGKSVFAATLINHLRQNRVPVLFFFFKQIIDANHQPIAAVHDWLAQVLPYSPPLQVKLMTYLTARQTLESLSIVELWRDLLMALRDIPRAFIVVDALDEMDRGDEMQVFLQHIAELASWRPAHTKMLITSRPVAYIETALRRANAVNIRLVENAVDVDIAAYVSHHLATSAINAEDQALIRAAVPGRANGLFIYAKLAMIAFLQPGANVRSVLDILPRDLNVMYNDLLRQHAARSGLPDSIQLLILQFVTHATRPLRLLEIASLINVSQYPPEKRDLKAMKELVRVACGPLLEVLQDETLSVIHHSLTEFLTGATRDIEDGGYPILDRGITHHQLSLACLRYLESEYLGNPNLSGKDGSREGAIYDGLQRDTFARYAGANWFVHARKAALAGADQADLLPLLDDIFGSYKLTEIFSMSKGGTSATQRWFDRAMKIRPVYTACTFGLDDYVKILLSRASAEANQDSELLSDSLLLAATKGDAEIVDALLKAGADPDERDRQPFSGKAPLHYAVEHNHPKVIKILLDGGADPMRLTHFNDPSSWGRRDPSAFEWACTKGHLAALQAFLPCIKSEKAISEAVSWVAPTGRADMLAAVLAHPLARVNDKTDCLTPLFLASGKRDAPMVRALLAAGADARTLHDSSDWGGGIRSPLGDEPGLGDTALHAWAAFETRIEYNANHNYRTYKEYDAEATVEVFKLLVEAGADVNQRNSDHYTPLHCAQDAMAARLLVEAGAEVDAVSRRGRTLVELSRDRATVQYLLEEGGASKHLEKAMNSLLFDRNQWYGQFKGDGDAIEMVQLLLDHGADPNIADGEGRTPLHHLVNHGAGNSAMRINLMKRFLRAGLDVNVRNAEGQRPLHLLSLKAEHEQNDAVFLDAMLDAGADIEAKDDLGRTPLFFRIDNSGRCFDKDTMLSACEVIASKGARLDTRDASGRTLLHAAISKGTGAVIAWLLDHGVDPKLTDDDGNSLFHEMMKPDKMYRNEGTRTYSICQKLVSLGVDMQQANSAGRTPLHMSISEGVWLFVNQQPEDTGPATVLDWILGRQLDVDVADRYGITPLHLASTFSEGSAEKLLEAGADPLKPTVEGLNCLHLAARARQVNILGTMLETIAARTSKGEAMLLSTATCSAAQHQRSPLFYACASGQPESVEVLLKAGMAVHTGTYLNSALQAVAEFEEEATHWPSQPTQYQHDKRCVGSVTLEDKFRKAANSGPRPTARIEEILDMLVVKDELFIKEHIGEAIEEVTESKAAHTLECLLHIRTRLGVESGAGDTDAIEALLETRQETRNSFEERLATRGSLTDDEFIAAMTGRFFDIVAKSMSPENSLKLVKEDSHTITRLQYLALGGYAALLSEVGHVESIQLLEDAKWVEKVEKESYVSQSGIRSLLITACARSIPNMAVVKVLVEKFGVGVNRSESSPRMGYNYQGDESASALHALAIGGRWWQLAEGIPYLVAHGADVNMKDGGGSSPLNTVLDRLKRCRWVFSKRACQVLLGHGADVTSTDNQGVSCVQRAIHDPEIHRLALFHVPLVSSHDLISAIESKNPVAVEALLGAGADPNGRDVLEVNEFHDGSPMLLKTKSTEMFPLEVAMTIFRPYDDCSVQPKMIESLLKYGADILATYGESTLIHQLLAQHVGEPFRQLLEKGIPGLDPNCTDANGVTMFHMACRYLGKVKTSRNEAGDIVYSRTDDRPSPAAVLLSLGADVYARDKSGRNALHHLVSPIYGCIDVDMVRRIATLAPELTNERDETGKTPLHMAVDDERLTGTNVVDALLDAGADPIIADGQGNTALHLLLGHKFHIDKSTSTVESPRATIIDSLLAVPGMDLNAPNNEGETPLFAYIRRGGSACNNTKDHVHTPDNDENWEGAMMDLLDARGANWCARNGVGKTLLHVTVEAKEWNLRKQNLKVPRVKYLLRKGVDPAAEDWQHRTALDYATSLGHEEVLKLFRPQA